jgi:hypothetical protein
MDPVKLEGIAKWPTPTTVKDVRSFLGFGNFYRRFIQNYGNLTKSLNELLKKDVKFEWNKERQETFDLMKKKFQESPVLLMPDPRKPFIVEADASKYASGAVLRQQDTNGDWHPCAYLSKSFNETERNYDIADRELLAIIRALTDWRHYLIGSPHKVTVLTDHDNLRYFRTAQKLNRRQARWSLFLADYDVNLVHVPGRQMVQSDSLSRRSDLYPEEDTDNQDRILLPDNIFIKTIDAELYETITKEGEQDVLMKNTFDALTKGTLLPLNSRTNDWRIENNLLFYKERCYVPDNLELRRRIAHQYHDTLPTGHPGQLRTQELIQEHYWWPGLHTFVKNYVAGCAICQQHKINRHPSAPALQPTKSLARRPYSLITMDFITDLPESDGFDSIMVMVDHGSSKGVILEPCNKTIDAEGTALCTNDMGCQIKQFRTEDRNSHRTSFRN